MVTPTSHTTFGAYEDQQSYQMSFYIPVYDVNIYKVLIVKTSAALETNNLI
uniref:Uncharacterized protein n=1 Tax=Arion vulgaris TaxID=1028688 RepID=A0A0B7BGK3_9EUPU